MDRRISRNSGPEKEKQLGQAMWSGTISFSLVAIPVELVKAVEPDKVPFHILHRKDNSPLLRRMYCPREGKPVDFNEMVRGFEIGPDKYVTVTNEELESLSPERSRTIEIMEFIDMKDIDPIYYDHPYWLIPLKGGEKAYRLLAEVMDQTGKVGLSKFVLREREHLAAMRSINGALSLTTLHYSEEILSHEELIPKTGEVDKAYEQNVINTIKEMTSIPDLGQYADGRHRKILGLLEKKEKESVPVNAPVVEEDEQEGVIDLVAVLQESMGRIKGKP
jgi:DNA end-binding protein Ku